MWKNKDSYHIDCLFDGEGEKCFAEKMTRNEEEDRYYKVLEKIHRGAQSLAKCEEIEDAQFAAYWRGIERRLNSVDRSGYRWWAVLSFTAAALLVAISLFIIFFGETEQVVAHTIVEEITTEIEGAEIQWFPSESGATIFIHGPDRDIW